MSSVYYLLSLVCHLCVLCMSHSDCLRERIFLERVPWRQCPHQATADQAWDDCFWLRCHSSGLIRCGQDDRVTWPLPKKLASGWLTIMVSCGTRQLYYFASLCSAWSTGTFSLRLALKTGNYWYHQPEHHCEKLIIFLSQMKLNVFSFSLYIWKAYKFIRNKSIYHYATTKGHYLI